MQFERRDIRDLSQNRYDRLAGFINEGGCDISLVNNESNIVYAFAGKVPEILEGTYCSHAVQVFLFNGIDMVPMGALSFDSVTIDQGSDGHVTVRGYSGRLTVFELKIDDALFDPTAVNIFD